MNDNELDLDKLLGDWAAEQVAKDEEEKKEAKIKEENEWDESHYFIG